MPFRIITGGWIYGDLGRGSDAGWSDLGMMTQDVIIWGLYGQQTKMEKALRVFI